jgi:type II restriction/modification system DNA methylase subunit YeeA
MTPNEADPTGTSYAFEKGATKTSGARGWADVWKRDHFALEYKSKGKDLKAAFEQLQRYALALDNPPLLAVCDIETFIIRTNWTNTVSDKLIVTLEELRDPKRRQVLKAMLSDPEYLRPGKTRQALTEDAAGEFAELAKRLRARGHDPQTVAHFINRLVFCLFADDVGLLPSGLLDKMLATARRRPDEFQKFASNLFRAMRNPGGSVGFDAIEWFNGGLFDDDIALPLTFKDIDLLRRVAALDWAEVDPSIFGTLFERGLDPDKRSQLGAHCAFRPIVIAVSGRS